MLHIKTYSVCDSTKSRFIKEQEAEGLLRLIGKTPVLEQIRKELMSKKHKKVCTTLDYIERHFSLYFSFCGY